MPTKDTAGRTAAVTVLMPAYNASRYIRQAIESVLAQTRPDFELIVIDDGSTDDTARIAEGFAAHDARIRVVRQANQGIGGARNRGLCQAQAPWVALLDSDDFWFPTYLEEQLAIVERHPEMDVLSANAVNVGGVWDGLIYNPRVTGDAPIEVKLLDLVEREDSVCILSLVRRRMLDTLGGFNVRLRGSEDYDLWLRGLIAGHRIFFNPTPLGGYRRRPDSVSADELRMLDAIVVPLRLVREHVTDDDVVRGAVEQKLTQFATRREVVLASQALAKGETATLTDRLELLHEQTGQARYRIAAMLCRHAPWAFLWSCRFRTALRRLRPVPGAGREGVPYRERAGARMPVTTSRGLDRVP